MKQHSLARLAGSVLLLTGILFFLPNTTKGQSLKITLQCLPDKDVAKEAAKKDRESKIKQPRLELSGNTQDGQKSSNSQSLNSPSTNPQGVISIQCTAQAFVTAGPGGPPNTTVNFTITQSNPNNILGLKWDPNGTQYSPTLQAPISLDANGYGVSGTFTVKGLVLGETTLSAVSPGFDGSSLDIVIVECKCPTIPVSSPPRN